MALAPLLAALVWPGRGAARVAPARRAFLLGLVTGAVSFAGTIYWTADVMAIYGDLARPVAVFVAALLVAYLALFPALAAVWSAAVVRRFGADGLLLAPAIWVATELGRTRLLTGFPWVLVGYSQVPALPVAQLASVLGVYGVSALVLLVNAALVHAVVARARRRVAVGATVAVLVALTVGWGAARLASGTLVREGEALRVGIVQGNVPQDRKWDPAYGSSILHTYLRLTRDAAARGARLVVWPESATPFMFEQEPAWHAEIRDLARSLGIWLLFGSDQMDAGRPPRYFNAAFLVGPDDGPARAYRKVHLVPFGEYVPLRTVLFFAAPLVESVSDFSAGDGPVLLPVAGRPISTAICYEAVFPALVAEAVDRGSRLLTTITNDAWYGTSAAPYQHFEQASMRAIEQGRYLVRAANTGISGIVDPYGRVLVETRLFETAALVGEVRLLEGRTLYGRIGDSFAWACVAVGFLALAGPARRPIPAFSHETIPGAGDPRG